MAGSWKEITGGRRIEDSGSGGAHIKDYIITFQAPTATAPPELGLAWSDVATQTANPPSSSGLTADPESVQVSSIKNITKLTGQVTVRFRGYHIED